MAGGFNCPWCRYYNATGSGRCGRCERWLPPAPIASLVRELQQIDLWATKLLAGVCALVFALELASGGAGGDLLRGMEHSTLLRFGALASLTNGEHLGWTEPWRLLSACFVHMGVLHVVMNLAGLVDLGRLIEREHGGQRLVVAFVVTGVLGFVASTLWYGYTGQPYITAGASGAVFGIDGVLLGDLALRRDPRWKSMLGRTVLYSFVFYFALGTNQAAHLGGLVVGGALGVLFRLESRPWRIAWLTVSLTAISIAAIAGSIAAAAASPLWRRQREAEEQRELARQLLEDQVSGSLRGQTTAPHGRATATRDAGSSADDGGTGAARTDEADAARTDAAQPGSDTQ